MVSPVPPNIQRFLPFIVIAFILLFILPAILKKHSSGPSTKTRAQDTVQALSLLDKGEQAFKVAHGKYTSHLADLVPGHPLLAADIGVGLDVRLDASTDGQSYLAQVSSDIFSLVRARTGTKVTAKSCRILKTGSGVDCPA
jgi:hypothetical protein